MQTLTHIDETGQARMVDVGEKSITNREALAGGQITMQPETLVLIKKNQISKGDVLATARIAGIMAAKKTAELIPLCHPLQITSIQIEFGWLQLGTDTGITIEVRVKNAGKTGVEMEALTAVSVAALTIYDMAKAVDKSMTIGKICLLEKRGGESGEYKALEN
jgi:cyclic pyranopterin phosphate synthase